jgi:hypothetical protein
VVKRCILDDLASEKAVVERGKPKGKVDPLASA